MQENKKYKYIPKCVYKDNNKGFTLVELIVVLVILAILAAIMVPTLLGYIDDAKNKEAVIDAKNALNASQSELTKLYAKLSGNIALGTNVIPDVDIVAKKGILFSEKNGDTDLRETDFANRVLNLAGINGDKKPYCLLIGVGSNCLKYGETDNSRKKLNVTLHDKYTVYYLLYIEKKEDNYLYYFNGEWLEINPSQNGGDIKKNDIFSKYNYIMSGSLQGKRIQYYLISYKGGYNFMTATFWEKLKEGNI